MKSLIQALVVAALATGTAQAADLKFKPGEGPFSWEGYNKWAESAPDLKGQQVTVFGPWLSPEDGFFNNALAYFEEATGADVVYTGSDSFEQQIVIDAEAGSAPNVAVFPQPGLAAVMAAKGQLTPLGDDMAGWVKDNYAAGQSWVNLGTYPDKDGKD
ncbi:MAG: extracellular solute-binding protein, partial [Thiolinea sp.]